MTYDFDVSVLIISFNTRDLTRECLQCIGRECEGLNAQIIVVDNASLDDSAAMVASEFPYATLLRSEVNLGFGNANNLALTHARGRYVVLLNTDAFMAAGALKLAMEQMDRTPQCGLAGGKLVGRDGGWQPSARMFHSVAIDAAVLTGMATRYPHSRIFGRLDRTWADQNAAAQVDWVPGAFSILRARALAQSGVFDPAFFLYYEEVDLCRRIQAAGWQVWYWPSIVVTHIGGESSRSMKSLEISSASAQVELWRMRSTFLYYRKHHGARALLAKWMEQSVYFASMLRNRLGKSQERKERAEHFAALYRLADQAWADTNGGRTSPQRPW